MERLQTSNGNIKYLILRFNSDPTDYNLFLHSIISSCNARKSKPICLFGFSHEAHILCFFIVFWDNITVIRLSMFSFVTLGELKFLPICHLRPSCIHTTICSHIETGSKIYSGKAAAKKVCTNVGPRYKKQFLNPLIGNMPFTKETDRKTIGAWQWSSLKQHREAPSCFL